MASLTIVMLIIWAGLFGYLWTLSRRLEQVKRKVDKSP
jgi:CcmD family protein